MMNRAANLQKKGWRCCSPEPDREGGPQRAVHERMSCSIRGWSFICAGPFSSPVSLFSSFISLLCEHCFSSYTDSFISTFPWVAPLLSPFFPNIFHWALIISSVWMCASRPSDNWMTQQLQGIPRILGSDWAYFLDVDTIEWFVQKEEKMKSACRAAERHWSLCVIMFKYISTSL